MEFEGHLDSYDHNHKKVERYLNLYSCFYSFSKALRHPIVGFIMQRFKEMKEMHGASSRDDRKKREQLRQERELTKMCVNVL